MAVDRPTEEERIALCEWLTANGIDPRAVPTDADMTIDKGPAGRFLRCEVFDRAPDGRIRVDPHDDMKAARMFVNVPLKVEPPDWWEPHEKPTRDQLLEAADRVRKLHVRNENTGDCEHCSARDYPDYSVSWPCETIRSMEGAP